jgi:hypothetical protein
MTSVSTNDKHCCRSERGGREKSLWWWCWCCGDGGHCSLNARCLHSQAEGWNLRVLTSGVSQTAVLVTTGCGPCGRYRVYTPRSHDPLVIKSDTRWKTYLVVIQVLLLRTLPDLINFLVRLLTVTATGSWMGLDRLLPVRLGSLKRACDVTWHIIFLTFKTAPVCILLTSNIGSYRDLNTVRNNSQVDLMLH